MQDSNTSADRIKHLLDEYKERIKQSKLADELYKWKLIEKFRGRPNLDAADFGAEITSIDYANLIYQMGVAVLRNIAAEQPEPYREAFSRLFDEATPLQERIDRFRSEVEAIYRGMGQVLNTHHDERTISTFLTFWNPDKYSLYKSSVYRALCRHLGIKPAKTPQCYKHYLELTNELIDNHISKDKQLIDVVNSFLTPDCYPDKSHRILVQDILYQILDKHEPGETGPDGESPKVWLYAPGEGGAEWEEFYANGIMALGWGELGDLNQYESREDIEAALGRIHGTEAPRNDSLANYEFLRVMKVGDIVIPKRGRRIYLGYGIVDSDYIFDKSRPRYNSVRRVKWIKKGEWTEDQHPIVLKTLTDISKYPDYVKRLNELLGVEAVEPSRVTHPAGPSESSLPKYALNRILYGPPGTGKTYRSIELAVDTICGPIYSDHRRRKQVFDELRQMGQIEFVTFHQNYSYEDFMVGIRPDVEGDELRFQTQKGIFYQIARRARDNYEASTSGKALRRSFDDVLAELLVPLERGEEVPVEMASGISFAITEAGDRSLNFRKHSGGTAHSISIATLRDVVEGVREAPGGLRPYYQPLANRIMELRETEEPAVPLKRFVLVIDEINRANISKVFGELITLLEDDKRLGKENELRVTLPNGEKDFGVPPNLYLIGTMNTADRSIALIDIALRRRFEFVGFYPIYAGYKPDAIALLKHINKEIYDKKKSADYLIGHAYFMNERTIEEVLQTRIIPLLMEYFSGNSKMVCDVFTNSGWSVTYDNAAYRWTCGRSENAAAV